MAGAAGVAGLLPGKSCGRMNPSPKALLPPLLPAAGAAGAMALPAAFSSALSPPSLSTGEVKKLLLLLLAPLLAGAAVPAALC